MFWHLAAFRLGYLILHHSAKWSRLKHQPLIMSHKSVSLLSPAEQPFHSMWGWLRLLMSPESTGSSMGLGLAERPPSCILQWCCLRHLSSSSGLDLLPSSLETETQERRVKVARTVKPKTGEVSNQKLITFWGKEQQHALRAREQLLEAIFKDNLPLYSSFLRPF